MSGAGAMAAAGVAGTTLSAGVVCLIVAWRAAHPGLARRVRDGLTGTANRTTPTGVWGWMRSTMLGLVEAIGSTTASVDRRLQLLGRPGALGTFRLQQFVAAVIGMVLAGGTVAVAVVGGRGGTLLALPLVVLGALVGAALWDQLLTVRSRARQRALDSQVPDASELLALAVGAGESVPGALERVARISSTDLASELALTGTEIRLGTPTSRALADLAARNDSPSLDRLCQTLITSIERGSPLAAVLHDQSRDIRESSRQHLMEEGGRREILMMMPVVFLILPITVLFALYPGVMSLEIAP